MGIKAALLDEQNVYVRLDELADASQLTPRHLPQITACDLVPGRYRWVADERKGADGKPANAYGGAFWPIAWLKRIGRDSAAVTPEHLEKLK